jgi:hypothetical protein
MFWRDCACGGKGVPWLHTIAHVMLRLIRTRTGKPMTGTEAAQAVGGWGNGEASIALERLDQRFTP